MSFDVQIAPWWLAAVQVIHPQPPISDGHMN